MFIHHMVKNKPEVKGGHSGNFQLLCAQGVVEFRVTMTSVW